MKIYIHQTKDFKYFVAAGKGFNLYCFSMRELISQLYSIYAVDLRQFLFNPFCPTLGIINHSQLN